VSTEPGAAHVEVGGDAVIYVNPENADGWRCAIINLSRNEALRVEMAARGRARAMIFSWRRSAQIYLEEIQRLLHN
jgi:glycosyltransferase involved in cell wall biosynthesis